jgi:hypothetical protein
MEEQRRIKELSALHEDIENRNPVKECRPSDSLFQNQALQTQTLSISKSKQQQEKTKNTFVHQHKQHLDKVQTKKRTLQTGNGSTLKTLNSTSGNNGGGIVKTVILPNEEINRLGLESQELK